MFTILSYYKNAHLNYLRFYLTLIRISNIKETNAGEDVGREI